MKSNTSIRYRSTSRLLVLLLAVLTTVAFQLEAAGQHHGRSNHHRSFAGSTMTVVYECDVVDVQPVFPGGDSGLLRYINSTRVYPEQAYRNRVEGRVLCSFVIMPDGSVDNITVLRGVEDSLDREAVRVIAAMPRWKAARVANEAVAVRYILPIHFRR